MKKKVGIENNFDDYVYEDGYYQEFESDIETQEEHDEKTDIVPVARQIIAMCEDCTNQWEDLVDADGERDLFCPLCGSSRLIVL